MPAAVTIVIPTYNMARFLGETLESLERQTFKDWEAVIVDDGSTDETPQVIEQFRSLPVRVLQQAHKGVAAARNKAIAESDGKFVTFLDADDVLVPHALESRVAALDRDPEVGMVYGRAYIIDGGGRYRGTRGKALTAGEHKVSPREAVRSLLERNPITTSSVMVRRDCLSEVGYFNEEMRFGGEDWELFLRLATKYAVRYLPEPLAWYRVHPANTTSTSSGTLRELDSRLVALDAFFASDGPGAKFRNYQSLALAAQHLRVAQAALVRRQRRTALQHFTHAIMLRRSRLVSSDSAFTLYLLAKSLFPERALAVARRVRWSAASTPRVKETRA